MSFTWCRNCKWNTTYNPVGATRLLAVSTILGIGMTLNYPKTYQKYDTQKSGSTQLPPLSLRLTLTHTHTHAWTHTCVHTHTHTPTHQQWHTPCQLTVIFFVHSWVVELEPFLVTQPWLGSPSNDLCIRSELISNSCMNQLPRSIQNKLTWSGRVVHPIAKIIGLWILSNGSSY